MTHVCTKPWYGTSMFLSQPIAAEKHEYLHAVMAEKCDDVPYGIECSAAYARPQVGDIGRGKSKFVLAYASPPTEVVHHDGKDSHSAQYIVGLFGYLKFHHFVIIALAVR